MPKLSLSFFLFVLVCGALPAVVAQEPLPPSNGIRLDTPIAATLEGGGANIWRYHAADEQIVTISAERSIENPESLFNLRLAVTNLAGEVLASDEGSSVGGDSILLRYVFPREGDYLIRVENEDAWQAGDYTLIISRDHLPPNCQTPQGSMITGEMPSEINGGIPVKYRVFLPPCHEVMQKRYPYLLLMHGSNSADTHWDLLGMDEAIVRGMALGERPPVALVLPFGSVLANTNTFQDSYSWESVVIHELMPYVEREYCLQNSREGRAIGGISRGGFWAFEIAFRHPELFSRLGGHSPFFDLYHAPAEYNPLDLVLAEAPQAPLAIWIDRGEQDYAQLNIDLIDERMTQQGIAHHYELYPLGSHNNQYWSAHVDDYLAFYTQGWSADPADLPDCSLEISAS